MLSDRYGRRTLAKATLPSSAMASQRASRMNRSNLPVVRIQDASSNAAIAQFINFNMPRLYIISGCNGAGKTTASYSLLPEMLDCTQFVNSDEFAKGLSPFNPEKASIQASRYMLMKIRYLLQREQDFAIETTLATRTLMKTVKMAQNAGYTVTLLYFWLNSPDLAVERVKARVSTGGHDIPEETIRRRYNVGIDYFFYYYAPMCERWILADNSQIPFRVIAEGVKDDIINIKDEEIYTKIRSMAITHHRYSEETGEIPSL